MQTVTIFHNSRCSKSRQTLALLQSNDCEIKIINYLEDKLTINELENILKLLNFQCPRELMRTKEKEYKDLNLQNDKLSRSELLEALIKHPKLLERPIVLANNKAAIGRPPENILSIL